MRKKWIILAVVLPLILALGLGTALITSRVSNEYRARIHGVEFCVHAGEWAQARALRDELQADWERIRPLLQAWIHHCDADSVTLALADLAVVLGAEDSLESLRALAELNEFLGHLYHRDAFSLSNLL